MVAKYATEIFMIQQQHRGDPDAEMEALERLRAKRNSGLVVGIVADKAAEAEAIALMARGIGANQQPAAGGRRGGESERPESGVGCLRQSWRRCGRQVKSRKAPVD